VVLWGQGTNKESVSFLGNLLRFGSLHVFFDGTPIETCAAGDFAITAITLEEPLPECSCWRFLRAPERFAESTAFSKYVPGDGYESSSVHDAALSASLT